MKYTLTKFKENISEAFELAERGQEVLIERYGRVFELKLVKINYSSYASMKSKEVYLDEPIVEPVDTGL